VSVVVPAGPGGFTVLGHPGPAREWAADRERALAGVLRQLRPEVDGGQSVVAMT
jgi:hypothetical protein